MQKLYICGPFRAPTKTEIKANVKVAEETALKYWQLGYNVYCPHLNSGRFHGKVKDELFLTAALTELASSDIVAVLPRWRKSVGSRAEHKLALQLNKVIWYEQPARRG